MVIIDNMVMTYVDHSNIHGQGLFAAHFLQEGQILGTLDGQKVRSEVIEKAICELPCYGSDSQNVCSLFVEWNALDSNWLLVRPYRTKYSCINHSRLPNIEVKGNQIVALRNILANEELTLDYRKEPLSSKYLAGHGRTYL